VPRRAIAVPLLAEDGVPGRDHGDDRVVDGEPDEREEDRSEEQGLRARAAAAHAEDCDPEGADADHAEARDGRGGQVPDQHEEQDVVGGERARGEQQQRIERLENPRRAQHVPAARAASRVLQLVDRGDEHRREYQQAEDEEEQSTEQLDRAQHSLKPVPRAHEHPAPLPLRLSSKPRTPCQRALLAQQGLELAAVARVEAVGPALVARVELALALAILVEGGGGRGGEGRGRDGGRGFDEGDGEEGEAGGGVDDVEEGADCDEEAEGEGQGAFAVCELSVGFRGERGDGRFSSRSFLK
jgi:hypothetical protein